MAVSLQNAPELQGFLVSNVRPTGRPLGHGAYGSVEEVQIPGALCAAKKIHDTLLRMGSPNEVRNMTAKFVDECQLMSSLRHPHIVQFLGICFLPGSRVPALVMEKLLTSLDELLERNPNIPLSIKRNILHDVARGLAFLHSQSLPIIHRDLTAKNVLLNSAMVAKIADLGVARIVNVQPGQLAATMTQAPGNIVYMPPEALEPTSRYNTEIDIFSLGNLVMYVLTQIYPNLLAPTYFDSQSGRIVARSEIERRIEYIRQIHQQLGPRHPLVQMVEQCLHNNPRERPSISDVLRQLEQARALIPDQYGEMNKLEMVRERESQDQQIRDLQAEVQVKEVERQQAVQVLRERERENQQQIRNLQAEVQAKGTEVQQLTQRIRTMESRKQPPSTRQAPQQTELVTDLLSQVQRLQLEKEELQTRLQQQRPHPPPRQKYFLRQVREAGEGLGTRLPKQCLKVPLSLKWRRGKNMPIAMWMAKSVILDGRAYIGGGVADRDEDYYIIQVYSPEGDKWTQLPRCPVRSFAMATVNHRLVLAGGKEQSTGRDTNQITVWDSHSQQWTHPYPAMPTVRWAASAIGYLQFLIVAGGARDVVSLDVVEVLNTSTSQWHTVDPLPIPCLWMTSALLGDTLYLLGGMSSRAVMAAHLPAVISQAIPRAQTATPPAATPTWEKLPDVPLEDATAVVLHNSLLAVGGRGGFSFRSDMYLYDPSTKQWTQVGDLPTGLRDCACTELPSGELLVLGGVVGGWKISNGVYIGTVDN